ncbi:MAG: Tetratricopeptide 2 [Betaproteobacteria bacterium]|nr:Tetratricopeptide 2 [Betaproteobacteria bacterium]
MSQIEARIAKQEKLVAKHPGNAEHWSMLGRLRRRNNQFAESIIAFTQCVALDSARLDAWSQMGFSFLDMFKLKEALETFAFVLQMEPSRAEAVFGCALAQEMMGNHADALELIDHAVALEPTNPKLYPLRAYLHATYGRDPAITLAYFRDWAERFADPLSAAARPLAIDRTPGRKLRIGYVSADLRNHSVAYFVEPIFGRHDRGQVHVSVFSSGAVDAVTERIRPTVDQWFDIAALSDDDACALIRRQKIDILIDLSGHTLGNRLMVFARRAAPVQLTYLGFMYTTGMRAMDYRLTDDKMDPPGVSEHGHSEQLFRLKRAGVYQPPQVPLTLEPPVLSKGRVTFASLNNLKKVTDEMLRTWRQILARVPESILIVIGSEQTQEEAIAQQRGRLEAAGLPLERICILPRLSLTGFLEMGGIVDVALDTSPLSGGTTTLHSLWMGLPIVCMAGVQAFEASTSGCLEALEIPETIATSEQEYIDIAVDLANSPERLAQYRASIRPCIEGSFLMDYDGFVADMEAAFRLMWLNYLRGEARYLDTREPIELALGEYAELRGQPAEALAA